MRGRRTTGGREHAGADCAQGCCMKALQLITTRASQARQCAGSSVSGRAGGQGPASVHCMSAQQPLQVGQCHLCRAVSHGNQNSSVLEVLEGRYMRPRLRGRAKVGRAAEGRPGQRARLAAGMADALKADRVAVRGRQAARPVLKLRARPAHRSQRGWQGLRAHAGTAPLYLERGSRVRRHCDTSPARPASARGQDRSVGAGH